ncbi:MAG: hypothetical protein LBG11_01505, partial [Bifidobacteriaceae bacterium]|nr:hypothetical protein [Bifidobacteriaceae bacterium]
VVSNIKAWEGAVCVAGPGVAGRVASNRFLQYRPIPTEPNLVAWLAQYLLSDEGLAAIGGASPGSADRNRTLSMDAFEAIEVPVPLRQAQDHIATVAARTRAIKRSKDKRDQLMDAVLPAARNEIFNAITTR